MCIHIPYALLLEMIQEVHRLDNMFFSEESDGSLSMCLADFQVLKKQFPEYDLAYFLTCGGGDSVRHAHEEELLQLYQSELAGLIPGWCLGWCVSVGVWVDVGFVQIKTSFTHF